MNGGRWLSRQRVTAAIYSRLVFQDRLATGVIVAIIMLWYVFQLEALSLGWNKELAQWVFTTKSFPALSPGLFLAIISHAFPPQVTHLVSNVVILWFVGGESEQHMSRLEVCGFFVVTAQTAILVGTAVSGGSIMGASGGGFAFVGFYCVHMMLEHRNELALHTLASNQATETPLRAYWGLFLGLTPVVLIPYLLGQQIGLLPAGNADIIGHLTGFLMGVGYAGLRSVGQ